MNLLLLILGLVSIFSALLLLTLVLVGWGGTEGSGGGRIKRRLRHVSLESVDSPDRTVSSSGSTVARNAVDLAGRLTARRDIDLALSEKIGAAGLKWSPAEWLLLHVGIAIGSGIVVAMLTSFRIVPTLLALVCGVIGPFVYLNSKANRRRAQFQAGLADMLQLIAGSLSAGYSMPQALDTVARESKGPIAQEFDRALLQARVGVPLEDALDGIAARMRSVDFSWIVMAIRVQREIGGNLAEVLRNVAETLRERDRIRRQVRVLSSEGRLSAWILGALPVVFAIYLIVIRPEYIGILITTPVGIMMLGGALVLFTIGVVWMTRIVKVEV